MPLANVKLGAVHGFAGPMGGMFPAPHGAICATLLPGVMEVNIRVAKEQKLDKIIAKFDEIGAILTGNPEAGAADGVRWVKQLTGDLKIPSLLSFGLTACDFNMLVEKAKKASSMKGNPVLLNDNQLMEILERSV